ncbi:glycosyltransferase family 4 protein [Brucepastera parasyntrophica]|uniref:glycosyltransferase family 4 protein n=1 Tax=Brucepastera parasyntrophica TaxID=2880008 RepID=UPI00210DA057|nr:glycosyltransferase family 4 protein [Brucepastera parasyntrophica]ULQ59882.1 glycosyltransferase family 4 protein [Brucepastera parasyntrophica]
MNNENIVHKNSNDDFIGIAVGTISYRKGYDLLKAALWRLCNNGVLNLKVFCVGDILDNTIAENVPPNMVLMGGITNNQIYEKLVLADFFILCSRDEGLPLSILEAMQCKLPIFATSVGSIPDIITPDEEGVLFNPNEEEIYMILSNIAAHNFDLLKMGENSFRKYKQCYSLDIMLTQYVRIIKEVV